MSEETPPNTIPEAVDYGEVVSSCHRRSATVARIGCALARAAAGVKAIEKGALASVTSRKGEASSYEFRYAELCDYVDAARPALSEQGVVVLQFPNWNGRVVTVETLILHESGEYFANEFSLSPQSGSPQEVSSALTYARRYSYTSILTLAAKGEDDDGNKAQGNHNAAISRPKPGGRSRPTAELTTLLADCRRFAPALEPELLEAVTAAGGNWEALPEDVGTLWSAGWRVVGDRLKAARQQAPRNKSQAAPSPEPRGDNALPKRGPKSLNRLRADCRRVSAELEAALVAVVAAAGGDWEALPDDCCVLFAAGWDVVGERVRAAQAAGLGGAETHNTPEAVAAQVAAIAAGMKMQ